MIKIVKLSLISLIIILFSVTNVFSGEQLGEVVEKNVSLIIGINDYDDEKIPNLRYAVDDAKSVKKVLEEQGEYESYYLASDSEYLPTKANIQSTLYNISTATYDIDNFVFYYSGHGYNVNGTNYIAPKGTQLNNIIDTAIRLDSIIDYAKKIQDKGANVIMFIDACRNNPESPDINEIIRNTWEYKDYSEINVMYSTSEGSYSYEVDGTSIFTSYLIGGLMGNADKKIFKGNEDNEVSLYEIDNYTKIKMKEYSNEGSYEQTPKSNLKNDFTITIVNKEVLEPPKLLQQPKIEVTENHIKVTWITNKETISKLYLDDEEYFNINNTSVNSYEDLSDDRTHHYALINYEDLSKDNNYYIKSMNEDYVGNPPLLSDEIILNGKDISKQLKVIFDEETTPIIADIKVFIDSKDYESAKKYCNNVIDLIKGKYNWLDISSEKYDGLIIVIGYLLEAEEHLANKEIISDSTYWFFVLDSPYIRSLKKALEEIEKNEDLQDFISVLYLKDRIKKSEYADEAWGLIVEGDEYYDNEDYKNAMYNFQEAKKIIEEENLEEIIPLFEATERINKIDDKNILLSKAFLQISFGIMSNIAYTDFYSDNHLLLPSWNISYNYRILVKGLSVDGRADVLFFSVELTQFNLGASIGLSNFNSTYGKTKSSEFYMKMGFSSTLFFKNFGYKPLSLGYNIYLDKNSFLNLRNGGLYRSLAINIEIGMIWNLISDDIFYNFSMPIYLVIGFSYNF